MLLSAEKINLKGGYQVTQVKNDTVEFVTDCGVEYVVTFMVDYSIWEENAYQLVIVNKNRKPSFNDPKLRDTLFFIIEDFFQENKNILLYICETGDGKQAARSKLFIQWFSKYEKAVFFYFKTTEILSEGEENFAAIILRKDNPELESIVHDFDEMISILSDKPVE